MEIFDSSFFIGQSFFFNDAVQIYLILQPIYHALKTLSKSEKYVSQKSKGLWSEKLASPFTIDNSISSTIK